jgi:membrane associated rhomboid family serine protease
VKLLIARKEQVARPDDSLQPVDFSVKSAMMAPRTIIFPTRANAPAVVWLVGLTCLPEMLLTLAGASGLVDVTAWRNMLIMHGAFWPGLLQGWDPMYAGQSTLMFLTYALLHGSLLHLVGNMVAVLALGGIVVARVGQKGFLLLYAVSVFGGALGYAMLGSAESPMVGASGGVFGLIGAWKFWEWQMRQHFGSPLRPLWRSLAGLFLLNVVLWLLLSGLLAWEAHLGGFIAGVVFAAIATPSLRHRV